MNNKFKSNSPEEAKAWLTEMFAHGAEWYDGGQEIKRLDFQYYCRENGIISCGDIEEYWKDLDLPEYSPILTPDFSNVQVGDRVKCLMFGEGVVKAVYGDRFECQFCGTKRTYNKDGYFYCLDCNPTLFYHFSGQFPTAEACVRPKPDPYELHGVTREQVAQLAKAVEMICDSKVKTVEWVKIGWCWATTEAKELVRVRALDKSGPYEHWQTPIVLGGE